MCNVKRPIEDPIMNPITKMEVADTSEQYLQVPLGMICILKITCDICSLRAFDYNAFFVNANELTTLFLLIFFLHTVEFRIKKMSLLFLLGNCSLLHLFFNYLINKKITPTIPFFHQTNFKIVPTFTIIQNSCCIRTRIPQHL